MRSFGLNQLQLRMLKLDEAGRPPGRDLFRGESRESTFVQREESCGENKQGYARLASRHSQSSCLSAGGLAHKGRADQCQAVGATTRPRPRRSSSVFAVTDSLIDAGIAPSIHLGRGIVISASSKTVVRAEIEAEEGEKAYVFDIPKEELWRAVVLIDEYGRGPGFPSAVVSRETRKQRRDLANMFLTNEFDHAGRSSTSSSGVTATRVSASSLSPAAALAAHAALSGTPATSGSHSEVVAGASDSSPAVRSAPKKAQTPAARAAALEEEEREGNLAGGATEHDPSSAVERLRDRQFTLASAVYACIERLRDRQFKSGCASNSFEIPLNLKREQHISRYASARYPICPIPLPPGWAPVVALPTVSSHVEFTAA